MAPDAVHNGRPFTTADARASGITSDQLRSGRFERVFRGCYVDAAGGQDPFARIRAAVGLHPLGAFASHLSAARLYRLPVPATPEEHVTVFSDADRRRRAGVRSHSTAHDVDVVKRQGIRVASPCATFVALGSILDLVELVIVGDAMVKRGLATLEELLATAANTSGKGAVAARRAAAYVRKGVDSPQESRLRMLVVLAGLPEPEVNHIIRNQAGEWVARFDLSYPDYRLLVEYDGRQHAQDGPQWERDIKRREMLDSARWRLVTITAKGIYKEPEVTLERIVTALRERGCHGVKVRSQAWRRYFATS